MRTCAKCKGVKDGSHVSYCRDCYNAYKRARYAENPAAEVARCSAWNRQNPDRVAANMRAARSRRPDHFRAYGKAWKAANPASVKNHDHAKRLRRRAAKVGTVAAWEMQIILESFQERACHYCGTLAGEVTIDHFRPIALGGRHEVGNLVPACRSCNSAKGAMHPEDFALRRGRLCW